LEVFEARSAWRLEANAPSKRQGSMSYADGTEHYRELRADSINVELM